MKMMSSFTHPQVVPNLYECLCSTEHKGRYSEECGKQSSSGAPLTSIVFCPIWKCALHMNPRSTRLTKAYEDMNINIKDLRSLHTESEIFACIFQFFSYSSSFLIQMHAMDAKTQKM